LQTFGRAMLTLSPADFGTLIADEAEKWRKLIPAANAKAEDLRGHGGRCTRGEAWNSKVTSTTLVSEAVRVLAYRVLTCQEADRRRKLPWGFADLATLPGDHDLRAPMDRA
jgi:hypothetical protein